MALVVNDKILIKKNVFNDFFLSNLKKEQLEVIRYVLMNKNLLTISKIEFDTMAILIRGILYFEECYGNLYDDQVIKACSIPIMVINSGDFRSNG
jgi:hypothetical protein